LSSLLTCIKKAGKALDAGDADVIRDIRDEYLADGMAATEAAEAAISDYLDILGADRTEILDAAKKAGGDIGAEVGGFLLSRRSSKGPFRRTKAGKYIGAPPGLETPQAVEGLIRKLRNLAKEGEVGRFWYEESSDAIMQRTGGDREKARKVAGVLAIYSAGSDLKGGTTMALHAWSKFQAGHPIIVGKPDLDEKALNWLVNDVMPSESNEKILNFYNNLMRQIYNDPSFGQNEQGVTADRWMARAFGYDTDRIRDAQYEFIEKATRMIADRLGWEPQQVQAAIWVATRAKKKQKPGESLREALKRSKMSFRDTLSNHAAQISWEAAPSSSLELMKEVRSAPIEQQIEFQLAISRALTDEHGNDLLAKELGLLLGGVIDGPAAWASKVGHGAQSEVLAPKKHKAKRGENKVDSSVRETLNAYADIMGLLLSQDAVAWHRPFYSDAKKRANGVAVDLGRGMTHKEASTIYRRMRAHALHLGLSVDQANMLAPIASDNGMRFISDDSIDNAYFQGMVQEAAEKRLNNDFKLELFAADSEVRFNDWTEAPNGQDYRNRIADAGLQDTLGWAESVLAPRIRAVYEDFARRYGWTLPADATTAGRRDASLSRPPVRADGRVELRHWSRAQGISVIDPRFHGKGQAGDEVKRKDSVDWVDRTYYGIGVGQPGGYVKERQLGDKEYIAAVHPDDLYDIASDPDGFFPDARKEARGADAVTLAEKMIRNAGYLGYWRAHPSMGMIAAVFEPLHVENPVGGSAINQPGQFTGLMDSALRILRSELETKWLTQDATLEEQRVHDAYTSELIRRSEVTTTRPEDGIKHSLSLEEQESIDANPTSPQSQWLKLQSLNDQAGAAAQGQSRLGIISWAKKTYANNKKYVLKAVPLRALEDFTDMRAVKDYSTTVNRMSGRENEIQNDMMEILDPWKSLVRKDREQSELLSGVMHESTLAGVDPSLKFKEIKSEGALDEAVRKKKYLALRRAFKQLSPEAQDVYEKVRNLNDKHYTQLKESLIARIEATDMEDEGSKSSLIARLRKEFERGHVSPYFPLARFGNHWAVAKEGDKVLAFSKFESQEEAEQWRKEWRKAGADTYVGNDDVSSGSMGGFTRIDPAFAAHVTALTKNISNKEEGAAMADAVWQAYLKRLPEMSARKAFIHRKGVSGFSGDAMRAFADNGFHMARQIAKVEYGFTLEKIVEQVAEESRPLVNEGDLWASAVAAELAERHTWVMEPRVGKLAAKLTGLGFHWFLGMNPSSAAVNLTQTWIMGLPILASYNNANFKGAAAALGKASMQMAGSQEQRLSRLNDEEREAFEEFTRIGLFDKTRAAELIAASEGGVDVTSWRYTAATASAFLFHKAEQFNREVTALAGYRMARKAGLRHEDAVLQAERITWDAHFDYSNKNRPALMQNNFARVALLFRNYGANATYRVARDLRDSFKADIAPEARKAAITRAAGIWMMTMMNAGAAGLPLAWLAEIMWGLAFGDDDEPIDPMDAMRLYLQEQIGDSAANWVMDGTTDAMLGVSISNRVSLSNLWFMDAPYEDQPGSVEWMAHYGGQAFGPLGSAVVDAAFGAKLMSQGDTRRGLEKMVPNELRNAMKAQRYLMEGVRTLNDQVIVPKDAITAMDSFWQAVGFTPRQVDLAYKTARAKKGIMGRLEDRKDKLRTRYHNAKTELDRRAVMRDIAAFDKKNPDDPLSPSLGASIRTRAQAGKFFQGGVRVSRKLQGRMSQIDFTEKEDE